MINEDCQTCVLIGHIFGKDDITGGILYETINGVVSSKKQITGNIALSSEIPTNFYDGPYEVTPMVEAQTVQTKDKYMSDDLTVKSIPYFDVSNTSGGSTVYIGSQIEIN